MDNDALCNAINLGIECSYRAVMIEPVPLCEEHQVQVALLVVPELLSHALRMAQPGAAERRAPADEAQALTIGAVPTETESHFSGMHRPLVYFVVVGDRVKIGTSTNLRSRLRGLSVHDDDVVLTLRGAHMLERALHVRFAEFRIEGTEWFLLSEPIARYIADKQEQFRQIATAEEEASALARALIDEAARDGATILAVQTARLAAARIAAAAIEPDVGEGNAEAGRAPAASARPLSDLSMTYPGTNTAVEFQYRALWELFARESGKVSAIDLAGAARRAGHEFCSESWVREALRYWASNGWVESEKRSGTQFFWLNDAAAERKDA